MPRCKAPHIPDVMLDQLLSGMKASAAFNQGGLLELSCTRFPLTPICLRAHPKRS